MTKELHEKLYHIRNHCLSSKGKEYLDEIEELLENCITPVAVTDCKIDEEELQKIIKRNTVVTISHDEVPVIRCKDCKYMVDLIGELSGNLKSAIDNNEEISENERLYLDGMCAGLKLASDTVRGKMNEID